MKKQPNKACVLLLLLVGIGLFLFPATCNAFTSGPRKIVSLGPFITDMVYLLGAEDKLAAVTIYCRRPGNSPPKEIIGTVMQMNVEKIVSLKPDLVLANALTRQKQIDALKNQGITVLRLPTPRNFHEICMRLTDLGDLIGEPEKAREVVSLARQEVQKTKSNVLGKTKRTVFIQIGLKPLKTVSKDTFIHEYIESAGGINIASGAADGVYSRERVVAQDPDVILIATMGTSENAAQTEKESWQRFGFLKAVKNNEIHIMNPDMVCSPTPDQFSKGLIEFYRLIHPVKDRNP